MLNNYFEKVYLVNLDKRPDRLALASRNCESIGLKYERFAACDGVKERLQIASARETGEHPSYWNLGAAGMVQSLIRLFKKCKEDKVGSVLILEDDVEFHRDINKLVCDWIVDVPGDWETLFFAGNHVKPVTPITAHVARMNFTYTLHCHAVRETVFDLLIDTLSEMRRPADVYYARAIHSRGKSYCFTPNLAYQSPSFSNIVNRNVNYSFLKR